MAARGCTDPVQLIVLSFPVGILSINIIIAPGRVIWTGEDNVAKGRDLALRPDWRKRMGELECLRLKKEIPPGIEARSVDRCLGSQSDC